MTTLANDRILFIHIPKTGGTWATEALRWGGVEFDKIGDHDHLDLEELDIGDRFAFAFVREPLSWYWSIWRFHRRNPLTHWEHLNNWLDLDFPDFVGSVVDEIPGYLAMYYRRFVGPPDAEINFIGRYERLADDLVMALQLAGQNFHEPGLRQRPARNFEDEQATDRLAAPPRAVPPECPPDLMARLRESEREIYERFYSGEHSPLAVGLGSGPTEAA